jgi:uncharacterized protein (TIGR01777 family)
MSLVLGLLLVQCLLGAFDNFWHHELEAKLPQRPAAREELKLHSARELIYGALFFGIAWWTWSGWLAVAVALLLAIEVAVTIQDFLVEDRTRRLPPLERALHTIMALNYGAVLAIWLPELWAWFQQPTGVAAVTYGWMSWVLTFFATGVAVWGIRNLIAVARLGVPEWQRNPLRAGYKAMPDTVLVTGGTGFVGSALVRSLVAAGDKVVVLSRDAEWARDRFGPLVEVIDDLDTIPAEREINAIVNLAGEPLAGGPWTAARKQRFLDSRVSMAKRVVALMRRLEHRPRVLVAASAAGYYGDRGETVLHETSGTVPGYIPELTNACEEALRAAQALGVRTCWLRIGYVLGAEGGMLRMLIPATRLGGGAVLGNGRQWVSWIHVRDLVRLIEHALHRQIGGPVNAVTTRAVTQREFTRALAEALHRPVLVRMPAWVLRPLLGDMAGLLLASQNVTPRRAVESGFRFEFEDLGAAFANIVGRPPRVDEQLCTRTTNAPSAAQRCAVTNRRPGSVGRSCASCPLPTPLRRACGTASRWRR